MFFNLEMKSTNPDAKSRGRFYGLFETRLFTDCFALPK